LASDWELRVALLSNPRKLTGCGMRLGSEEVENMSFFPLKNLSPLHEAYAAAIGRAIAVCQHLEDCASHVSVTYAVTDLIMEGENDSDRLAEVARNAGRARFGGHIKRLASIPDLTQNRNALEVGREARNWLAHEAADVIHVGYSVAGLTDRMREFHRRIRELCEADEVLSIASYEICEREPAGYLASEYASRLSEWVFAPIIKGFGELLDWEEEWGFMGALLARWEASNTCWYDKRFNDGRFAPAWYFRQHSLRRWVPSRIFPMTEAQVHRDNHYVPRSYLKRWSRDGSKVCAYRILVSHSSVPLWRPISTRAVAYHEHLYTTIAASGESDRIERWLDSNFEAPAEPVIEKAISGRPLSVADWETLIRFFAAQDVRTPARLMENLTRWSATLPDFIQESMKESVAYLEAMTPQERAQVRAHERRDTEAPFRVKLERDPASGGGWLKGETIIGRGLWLWSMEHVLNNTLQVLLKYRWTILMPPDGMTWFTSDDPVLKLNFNSPTDYSFGGGWGSEGTDLLLPLGPHHMLFTQVGKRVPPRGTRMSIESAERIRRLIAEHAHRYIFADSPDPFVEQVRPLTVNAEELKRETLQWERWHSDQSVADRDLAQEPSSIESPNIRWSWRAIFGMLTSLANYDVRPQLSLRRLARPF
jgi:Protein of unknown function (DUF4238)